MMNFQNEVTQALQNLQTSAPPQASVGSNTFRPPALGSEYPKFAAHDLHTERWLFSAASSLQHSAFDWYVSSFKVLPQKNDWNAFKQQAYIRTDSSIKAMQILVTITLLKCKALSAYIACCQTAITDLAIHAL